MKSYLLWVIHLIAAGTTTGRRAVSAALFLISLARTHTQTHTHLWAHPFIQTEMYSSWKSSVHAANRRICIREQSTCAHCTFKEKNQPPLQWHILKENDVLNAFCSLLCFPLINSCLRISICWYLSFFSGCACLCECLTLCKQRPCLPLLPSCPHT